MCINVPFLETGSHEMYCIWFQSSHIHLPCCVHIHSMYCAHICTPIYNYACTHTVHMYYTIHTWTHTYTLVVRNCIECRIWCQRDNLKIAKTGRKRKYQKDQELELGRWLVLPTNVQPHFTSSTHKKQGTAVQAHNPRAGEAETKGSIGFAGQPI